MRAKDAVCQIKYQLLQLSPAHDPLPNYGMVEQTSPRHLRPVHWLQCLEVFFDMLTP
jgi:hypothetical protein